MRVFSLALFALTFFADAEEPTTAMLTRNADETMIADTMASATRILGSQNQKARLNDGYKQVNTVLSEALMNLIRNGQSQTICTYNAGFPAPDNVNLDDFCAGYVVDPDRHTRVWSQSIEPVGILKKAINSGTFKWCTTPDMYGSAQEGFIEEATEDNFLQGIKTGDYYGVDIDKINALTAEMAKILGVCLKPKLVKLKSNAFETVAKNLANNNCYATLDRYVRHPYREVDVDFTAATKTAPAEGDGLGLIADAGDFSQSDFVSLLAGEGTLNGVSQSVCVLEDAAQEVFAERNFRFANVVPGPRNEIYTSFCTGSCDFLLDDLNRGVDGIAFSTACQAASLNPTTVGTYAVTPTQQSSGGDIGAMTNRLC